MNTDKTLRNKFGTINTHPVWYYKELQLTDVAYVIFNLLKESFVVEIDGSKHEITFGKNRKGEIGHCVRYNDLSNSRLVPSEVVKKGLREGKWFIITDVDTSVEFKRDYDRKRAEFEREEYRSIFKRFVENAKDINEEQRRKFIQELDSSSYEELDDLMKVLSENRKHSI